MNNIKNIDIGKHDIVLTDSRKATSTSKLEYVMHRKKNNLCKIPHNYKPYIEYQNQLTSSFKIIPRKLRNKNIGVADYKLLHKKSQVIALHETIDIEKWRSTNNYKFDYQCNVKGFQDFYNDENNAHSVAFDLNPSASNQMEPNLDSSSFDPNDPILVKRKSQFPYPEESCKKIKTSQSEDYYTSPILDSASTVCIHLKDSSPVIGLNKDIMAEAYGWNQNTITTFPKIESDKNLNSNFCLKPFSLQDCKQHKKTFKSLKENNYAHKYLKSSSSKNYKNICRKLNDKLKPTSLRKYKLPSNASTEVPLSPVLNYKHNNHISPPSKKYNKKTNCCSQSKYTHSVSVPNISNNLKARKPLMNLLHDFTNIENDLKTYTTQTLLGNMYTLKPIPCYDKRIKNDQSSLELLNKIRPCEELQSHSLTHFGEESIACTPKKLSPELDFISPILKCNAFKKSDNRLIHQNRTFSIHTVSDRINDHKDSFTVKNNKINCKSREQVLPHCKFITNWNVLKETLKFNPKQLFFDSNPIGEHIKARSHSFKKSIHKNMNLELIKFDLNSALSTIQSRKNSENGHLSVCKTAMLHSSKSSIDSINNQIITDCPSPLLNPELKVIQFSEIPPQSVEDIISPSDELDLIPNIADCIISKFTSSTLKEHQHINDKNLRFDDFCSKTPDRIKSYSNNSTPFSKKRPNIRKSIRKNLFTKDQNDNIDQKSNHNHGLEGVDLFGEEQIQESDKEKVIKINAISSLCETNMSIDQEEHSNSATEFFIEHSDDESFENNWSYDKVKQNPWNDICRNEVSKWSQGKRLNEDAKFLCFKPQEQNISEFLDSCLGAVAMPSQSNHNIESPVSSQENVMSPMINIDCPSSTTKISQEMYSPSYLPALNLPEDNGIHQENLDSASKSRRIKKGSYVERLSRLVRAERAEVNMFNHEGPVHQTTQPLTLTVDSVIKTCSRLMLRCHHVTRQYSYSEDFGSEEVVDPVVQVCIDPIYAKTITTGSTISVYPPWHSLWSINKGMMILYCVAKLHVHNLPSDLTYLPQTAAITSSNLFHQFSCQFEEDRCICYLKLIEEIFNEKKEISQQQCATDGSVKGALTCGHYAHCFQLRLTLLHSFYRRNQKSEMLPALLGLDSNNELCQLNLQCVEDGKRLQNLVQESKSNTFKIKNVTLCKQVFIDRCRGLRSMVSQLYKGSADQELMYVVTPSCSDWTVQPICGMSESSHLLKKDLNLDGLQVEAHDVRVNANFLVLALRKDILYAFNQELDSLFKIKIALSALIPTVCSRNVLHIQHLHYFGGTMTLDKFSIVTVINKESSDFPPIPSLSAHSEEGDLVTLDSVVTRASSGVFLRWEGDCGHSLLKPLFSSSYYCGTCKSIVTNCHQRISLEVCVYSNLECSIRVKLKNETAQVFLLGETGHVSPDKSYNMISMIGARLKCFAVVLEVSKNSSGNVLEFLLEET